MAARNFVPSDTNRFRVFVGSLPKNIVASNIEQIFNESKIAEVHLVRNPETDEFRGFAYVEFKDRLSYEKALLCDGTVVNGCSIRVNDAERKNGRGGPGGRGGRGGGNPPRSNREYGGSLGRDLCGPPGRDLDGSGYGSRSGGIGGRLSNMRSGSGVGGPVGRGGAFGSFDRPRGSGYRPRVQEVSPVPDALLDSKDRPRLSLQPRSKPVEAISADRELSERSKAIFGVGKPRSASPPKPESNGSMAE